MVVKAKECESRAGRILETMLEKFMLVGIDMGLSCLGEALADHEGLK
jgi:hypothetical protein